jgi:hypothetical protein
MAMTQYPIFLLPQDDFMVTAKVENDKIQLLKKTSFPSGKRYFVSETGSCACLDKEKKVICCGQLTNDGSFEFTETIPFPKFISPKSICVIENQIILGGDNEYFFGRSASSEELIVTYNPITKDFTIIDVPYKNYGKCIDDLLVDEKKVIAVDDIREPKYLFEYDFTDSRNVRLIGSYRLYEGVNERISKGSLNEFYVALLSSYFVRDSAGIFITIFKKGDYKNYIILSQRVTFQRSIYDTAIFELDISARVYNCLEKANIKTIGDLVQKTEREMLEIKNFGRKSLSEIKQILLALGVDFAMDLRDRDEKKQADEKLYSWRDIILIDNMLCISASEDGIGCFKIKDKDFSVRDETKEVTSQIQYHNPWNKNIVKILPVPNNKKQFVLIASPTKNIYEHLLVDKQDLALN